MIALKQDLKGNIDSQSRIEGRVEIKQAVEVVASTIRGPVSIAENCRIQKSYINPFTSIGAGTVIEDSSVENSVIMENCRISNVDCLTNSVIGRSAQVSGRGSNSAAVNLFVGDNDRVEL